MGSCQNYGQFLGTLNNRCRTIMTTTHIFLGLRCGLSSLRAPRCKQVVFLELFLYLNFCRFHLGYPESPIPLNSLSH